MLDKTDSTILVCLDRNARQSFSRIAQKTRTSKSVVGYRVNQLMKKGVVRGFYAVINTMKLGYHNYRIYIKLQNCNMKEREELIGRLTQQTSTWWVARITYPWDIAAILLAKSTEEANEKLGSIIGQYQEKIARCSVNQYVQLMHFPKDYLPAQNFAKFCAHWKLEPQFNFPIQEQREIANRHAFVLGGTEIVRINPIEEKLLLELSKDARAGTVLLAKKLRTTPMVIKHAIKRLLKTGVILGFRVLLDYERIGYEYYWMHIDVSAKRKEVAAFACALPNTVYYDETLGGSPVEFAVHIKKEECIQSLIDVVLGQFGSVIKDYNYFRVIKNEKVVYMPQE